MGLGAGLVKRVFCKSGSSVSTHSGNMRNFRMDKSRWNAVRLYLCGDELSSVLVENDSSSIRGSETTVMQQLAEDSGVEESCQVTEVEDEEPTIEEENSSTKFAPEEAATFIQSVFRGFMVRREYEESRMSGKLDGIRFEDPSEVNEAASTEVLASETAEDFKLQDNVTMQHLLLHKSHSQTYRLKEEWDDSTLSSDILKLRIQNKLEATTRRERALAYAFSQQLRTCTTKKKSALSDSTTEPNTGWSWLERWMATRAPENPVDDCWSKHLEPITTDRRLPIITNKRLDLSFEEKESCGSNDVSVNFEGVALSSQTPRDKFGRMKNKLKTTRSVSRRKTMPEYYRPVGSAKVSKKDSSKEAEKEKRSKQVQSKNTGQTKSNASQAPIDC